MDRLLAQVKRHAVDIHPAKTQYPPHRILPDVTPYRHCAPTPPGVCIETPFCAFILQGEKEVLVDHQTLSLHAGQFSVSVIEMPISSRISSASPDKPFYGLVIRLDLEEIGQFIQEHGLRPADAEEQHAARMAIIDLSEPISDVLCRLLALLDREGPCPLLASLYRRELYYWLLQGPQGTMLFRTTEGNSQTGRVRRATEWLRRHFDQPLSIRELAAQMQMSQSGFHQHFRSLTGLTPLQFQKQLRLQEARRLMLGGQDASSAAFSVGYESASQFSREYRRLFGRPPQQDIRTLLNTDPLAPEGADVHAEKRREQTG